MKIVFDEWYGTMSYAQRAAYRKYNVSPSDHDQILRHFEINDYRGITDYVKSNAEENGGMFSFYSMIRDYERW